MGRDAIVFSADLLIFNIPHIASQNIRPVLIRRKKPQDSWNLSSLFLDFCCTLLNWRQVLKAGILSGISHSLSTWGPASGALPTGSVAGTRVFFAWLWFAVWSHTAAREEGGEAWNGFCSRQCHGLLLDTAVSHTNQLLTGTGSSAAQGERRWRSRWPNELWIS